MDGEGVTTKLSVKPLHLLASAVSSSIIVKSASVVILIFYFTSYSSVLFDHMTVIPGYVLPPNFWIWTLVTHSFLQSHILLALIDILVVLYTGVFLEPVYKPIKLGLFFVIVTVCSALSTSMVYIILYYVSGNTDYIFETRIHGLEAYIGGLVVAMKQLMPDQILLPMPWGKILNKHLPIILLAVCSTLTLLHLIQTPYTLQVAFGMLISWIYLRFYQKHDNGNVGDMAEEFSFAHFFPSPLQLPIAIISNTVFSMLVRFKVCKRPQRKYDVSSPTTITVTLPGTDPADAERRRQLAIKALNDRLNATTDSELAEEGNWPGLIDEDEVATESKTDGATSETTLVHDPATTATITTTTTNNPADAETSYNSTSAAAS